MRIIRRRPVAARPANLAAVQSARNAQRAAAAGITRSSNA